MKRRLLLSIFMLVLAFVVLLTGCAPSTPNTNTTNPNATTAPVLKAFKIGTDNTYPPMEFADDENNTVGFDVDMAAEICKRIGRKMELVPTQWSGIETGLTTKKFDCIISSYSITKERQVTWNFTQPYVANAQVFIVPAKNDTIKTEADLAGKRVGAQINTTSSKAAETVKEKYPFELTTYESVLDPFNDLSNGKIDAICVDIVVAADYVTKSPEKYKYSGIKLAPEGIGIAFRKEDTDLLKEVDAAITAMKKDGTMSAISIKWLGVDSTQNLK